MKRHCSCQWCVRPHSGNESIKKGWPFSLGWSENSPILDLKWEVCDVIPLALAYLLFYYLHQCISYLQRRLGCSSALHFIIDFGLSPWPSAASLSLTQTKGLRQFSCLSQCPYGHSGLWEPKLLVNSVQIQWVVFTHARNGYVSFLHFETKYFHFKTNLISFLECEMIILFSCREYSWVDPSH